MKRPATPSPSELDIQASFIAQLRYVAPEVLCVAIPNAARRTPWEVRQNKKAGLATGFPDCLVLSPGGRVALLEFKRPAGKLSDNQREWLERLGRYGFHAAEVRSVDEANAFLRACGFSIRERVA